MGNRTNAWVTAVVALLLVAAGVVPDDVSDGAAAGGSVPGEMAATFARSLEALDAPPGLIAAAEDEDLDRDWPYVRAVNDLDGDGRRDVVSVAYSRPPEAGEGELVLTARRGLDGEVLFTHRRAGTGWDTVTPVELGGGEPGLLLVRYRGQIAVVSGGPNGEEPFGVTDYGTNVGLELIALDATGDVAWERTFEPGHYAYPGAGLAVARDVAIVGGLLEGAGATGVLVGVYDRTTTPAGRQGTLRALVVDGADGSDRSETTIDIADEFTALATIGDVDGDGDDDVAVLLQPQEDETAPGTLRVHSGADGDEVWSAEVTSRQALLTSIRSVGDMTGDGATELALITRPWPFSDNPDDPIDLVSGASGQVLKSLEADGLVELGDITGDGLAEVGTWSTVESGPQVGARYAAHAAAGPAIYETEHLVSRSGAPGIVRVAPVGDVDGDGVVDLSQEVPLDDELTDARVIDGRDGTVMRSGELGGVPTGASIGGDGADFVASTPWGRSVRDVSAVDGRTGDALWTTRLRARGQDAGSTHTAVADLDGDGHGEVIVSLGSSTVDYEISGVAAVGAVSYRDAYILSGRDGAVLWQTDPDPPLEPATVDGEVHTDTPFTWEGSPGPSSSWGLVRAGDCTAVDPTAPCERLLLRLSNHPAEDESSRTATGVVEIADFAPAPAPVSDFDLYVFESDQYGTRGHELGRSTNWFDPGDERVSFPVVTTPAQPWMYVLVEVVAYDNPTGSSYQGAARLE